MKTFSVCIIILICSLSTAFAETKVSRNEEIRGAIEAFLLQKTNGADFEARVKRVSLPNLSALLTAEELDYEIIAPPQWEGWGNVNLAVVVRQGDRILRNIPVRLEVEALSNMVVATRQIEQGATVAKGDVAIRKQEISSTKGFYFSNIEEVIGRRARVTLRNNRPIKPDQVEKIALIRSGQIVTAVIDQGSLRITMSAKAKQSGALGDTITLQNSSSLKEFPGRIIDANTVLVIL